MNLKKLSNYTEYKYNQETISLRPTVNKDTISNLIEEVYKNNGITTTSVAVTRPVIGRVTRTERIVYVNFS